MIGANDHGSVTFPSSCKLISGTSFLSYAHTFTFSNPLPEHSPVAVIPSPDQLHILTSISGNGSVLSSNRGDDEEPR